MLLRIMRLVCRISSKIIGLIRHLWHYSGFILEMPLHNGINVGQGTRFNVPVRSRGGRGRIIIGESVMLGWRPGTMVGNGLIQIQPRTRESVISIGKGCGFNNNVSIIAMKSVSIGEKCLVGDQVTIYDADFHDISSGERHGSAGAIAPVVIGDNVWLGSKTMILKGVTIGDNSVIGACSLVVKSIPANVIAAGVPAKVIRKIGSEA